TCVLALSRARPEEPGRPPEEEADGRRVNEERPELRKPVLARGVADADQQRRHEGPTQAAEPTDRHHDEEVDEVLEGVRRLDGDAPRPWRPAEAGQPAAQRERERE